MGPDPNQSQPTPPNTVIAPYGAPPAEAAPTQDNSQPVTPIVSADPVTAAPVVDGVASNNQSPRRKLPKLLIPVLAVVLILGAGSAAAFYGVIMPNQPVNILKTAIGNTLQQHQISSDMTYDSAPTSGGGLAYKIETKTSVNLDTKSIDSTISTTVSGVTIPTELRIVNQTGYLKFGDLSSAMTLLDSFMPGASSTFKATANVLSNKWVAFDSTLLKEAGVSCALNTDWTISKSDIAMLEDAYQKNSFVTIKSTASDTVNGQAADKMVLSVNDNKGATYLKNLDNLTLVKNMQKCANSQSTPFASNGLADGDTTPVTVWVDKASKRIVKLEMQSTKQDASQNHLQGSLTATFSYGPVNISAPQGAVPALQMLAQIEASNPYIADSFGGLSDIGGSTSLAGQSNDTKRQSDIVSIQTQLEAFFASNGYYPSLTDMNNASWRAANLKSLDVSALQDPQGSVTVLAATPAAKVYAYQVTNSAGKSCEASDKTCAQYTLTATLSDGTTFVRKNLD